MLITKVYIYFFFLNGRITEFNEWKQNFILLLQILNQ